MDPKECPLNAGLPLFVAPIALPKDEKLALSAEEFEGYIKKNRKNEEKKLSFVEYLYSLMGKYGYKNAFDFYNKALVSRQLYYSIVSSKSSPSLNVSLKLAFALSVTNHERKHLLKKAGYTLAS